MLLHAPRPTAPTPLNLRDLIDLTRRVAAEVRAGRHQVHVSPSRRWYARLRGDHYVDVWLIGWAAEQAAELHDHAGLLGALTVVSGSLIEQRWVSGGLQSRRIASGRSAGFPLGHVHDVANLDVRPAVSVHAYSPPLTAMSYYTVEPDARLRRTHTVLTGPGSGEDVG